METNIEIIRKAIKAAGGSECGSLSDVLLAMQMRGENFTHYHVSTSGHFWRSNVGNWTPQSERWDLHKDSLTDQSNECLTFLANLLK